METKKAYNVAFEYFFAFLKDIVFHPDWGQNPHCKSGLISKGNFDLNPIL